jgi:hypothetical protein
LIAAGQHNELIYLVVFEESAQKVSLTTIGIAAFEITPFKQLERIIYV